MIENTIKLKPQTYHVAYTERQRLKARDVAILTYRNVWHNLLLCNVALYRDRVRVISNCTELQT